MAAAWLVGKGFTESGLKRITATTYEENLGSRRVLEKVGMMLCARIRMTEEDLARQDTSLSDGERWPGDDLFYELLGPQI